MKLKHLCLTVMTISVTTASGGANASGYQFGSQSISAQGSSFANGAEANDASRQSEQWNKTIDDPYELARYLPFLGRNELPGQQRVYAAHRTWLRSVSVIKQLISPFIVA